MLYVLYALLVFLASLNRETGAFLVVFYAAAMFPRHREPRVRVWGAVYAVITIAVFVGLRLWLGEAEHLAGGIGGTWAQNLLQLTDPPPSNGVLNQVIFVPLLYLAARNYRCLPALLQRLVIASAFVFAFTLAWALWNEVRAFYLPIWGILLPAALYRERSSA